ncbi:MAG: hypothetical protein HY327_03400 [Chloroflexi bacterium]|nr:hypothetical protein [Chloroflexota bacterium]
MSPKLNFSVVRFRLPLITILAVMLMGGMYAVVNTQITLTGQRVLDLQNRLERLSRENQELDLELAKAKSFERIEPRARALGLRPIAPTQTTYLVVKNIPASPPVQPIQPNFSEPSRSVGFLADLEDLLSRVGLAPGNNAAEAGTNP